jgi:hypothetical protein
MSISSGAFYEHSSGLALMPVHTAGIWWICSLIRHAAMHIPLVATSCGVVGSLLLGVCLLDCGVSYRHPDAYYGRG